MAATLILLTLTLATSALAAVMTFNGNASWLEAASFVTGAICVWLTVKESVWNFPIGLANVATFFFVFLFARLFADASLQIVYFILGISGWYLWLHGGEKKTALKVERASWLELGLVLAAVGALTGGLYMILHRIGGSASFLDALTTSLSLGAQWLLNKKRLENWILWIIADIIYIPLYLSKDLLLTAILYAVFLVMAFTGYFQWHTNWRLRKFREAPGFPVITPAVKPFDPEPGTFPVVMPEEGR